MKLNVKKLNQYFMNLNNSCEMKGFVQDSANSVLCDEIPDPKKISLLQDLGLIIEDKKITEI